MTRFRFRRRSGQEPADVVMPRFRPAMFAALRHPNYRLYWIGTLVANTGDWMDHIALGWLMWELTGSGSYLGLLAFFRAFPILFFTLFGGALADRMDRRRLMQGTQAFAMLLALLLALLVVTDLVEVWHVLAIASLRGIMLSVNLPTRQALLSDIVDREHLANAIALNSATMNLTRIVGGSLGGVLITLIGIGGVFLVNGLSFIILIAALAMMTIPSLTRTGPPKNIMRSIAEGLSYLREHQVLRPLIFLALVPMVFGMPYMTLLPIFADTVLDIGNEGYGLLVACVGVGALAGSLVVAALSQYRHRGRLMLLVMVLFGGMLLLFSQSTSSWLSYALLFGVGAGQTSYMALNTTLLQTHSSDEMRGRVMSIFFLNRGLVPLGTVGAGVASEAFGAPVTVAAMAAVVVLLALATLLKSPRVRNVE
ncbi:MAG TPA: MFS transporter [Thermomicrobiales bacterium]|nr:MFS transporter [Thermomicrobiales bacterium]